MPLSLLSSPGSSKTVLHYVAQVSLKLVSLLLSPPKSWDHRYGSPNLTLSGSGNCLDRTQVGVRHERGRAKEMAQWLESLWWTEFSSQHLCQLTGTPAAQDLMPLVSTDTCIHIHIPTFKHTHITIMKLNLYKGGNEIRQCGQMLGPSEKRQRARPQEASFVCEQWTRKAKVGVELRDSPP